MNSSSEQVVSYAPLEYEEACEPLEAESSQQASQETGDAEPATSQVVEQQPDPAVLLAARIEEETRIIAMQARHETEREIQRVRGEITRAIENFAQQRDEYFRQAESEVINLALAIARRLIHREAQIDNRLINGLVNYELNQLDAATKVRLFVSPDTVGSWNDAATTMSRPVEIAADRSLASGEARIETSLGSTTVSLERELKEIESGFFDLLSHRPAAAETRPVRVQ